MTHAAAHSADQIDALPDLPADRRPQHIAIIMDGNGRWARAQGQLRVAGHRAGAQSVREIVMACGRLGVKALTLFSFSMENWKRPSEEVGALMQLLLEYLRKERDELLENNICFRTIGRRQGLPEEVLTVIDEVVAATAQATGLNFTLALNYSSRTEITDAVIELARRVVAGDLEPEAITPEVIASQLDTGRAGLADPDLLIRTAGEMRVSNFLLWQISYAELFVTDVLWPDFRAEHLHEAMREYARRDRRYGAIESARA